MKRPALLIAAALTLALLPACGEPQPLTQEAILAEAAALPKPQPGLYRTTTQLAEFALPGASPEEAERMQERMGGIEPQIGEACVSAQEAEAGFSALVEALGEGDCTFSRFDVEGARMGADLTCRNGDGTDSAVTMLGESGAQSSRLENRIVQTGEGIPGGRQEMRVVIVNERIGDCPAPAPAPEAGDTAIGTNAEP